MRTIACCLLLTATLLRAQDLPVMPDYKEIAQKGYGFEQAGEVDSALFYYEQVSENDSMYTATLFQRGVIAFGKDDFEMALALNREGYELHGDMEGAFGKNMALAMAKKKDHAGALQWIDGMIAEFPASSEVRYTKGLVLEENNDHAGAIAVYEDVARRDPFHGNSHRRLAVMALNEGKLSQAAMGIFFYLYVSPADQDANLALAYANEFLRGSVETEPKHITLDKDENFDDIDLLLQNRIALQRNYKAVPDIDVPFARQMHLLIEQLAQQPEQKGFWSTYYVPVFLKVREEGLLEGFVFHCLSSSEGSDHIKLVKKNQSRVDLFRRNASRIVEELHCTWPDSVGGTVKPVRHLFNDERDLFAIGTLSADGQLLTGDVRFFHDNGRVSDEGRLDDQGHKQDEWRRYHPNGRLKAVEHYIDDEFDGPFVEYYDNGALEDSGRFAGKKFDGDFHEFKRNGARWRVRRFDPNGSNGPATIYYDCGAPSFTMNMKDGLVEGDLIGTFPDGGQKVKGSMTADKRQGPNTEYFRNGQVESTFNYVDGEASGPFTNYHPNGQVASEGAHLNGNMVGEVRSFAIDGTLIESKHFDDKGKWHGLYQEYDTDAKLTTEQEWNHGVLMRYRYYDKSGAVIHEAQRQKGKFDFEGYSPSGGKSIEGTYLASEGKEGEWKYYWPDGTLRSSENFVDARLDGVSKSYYSDGTLRSEQTYTGGEETGAYRYRHASGRISEEGFMVEGELHQGRVNYRIDGSVSRRDWFREGDFHGWSETVDPDGKLVERDKYEDGSLSVIELFDEKGVRYQRIELPPGEMKVVEKNPDGTIRSERTWLHGNSHGPLKVFFPNGKVNVEGQYFNDERHGTWKYYLPSGKQSTETSYDVGKRHGANKQWYENGKLRLEETYEQGEQNGERTWYYENGTVLSRTPFVHGNEHGEARYFNDKGDLELVRYYRHGELIGWSYEGPDGQLLPMIPVTNGTAHIVSKYRNGQVSRDMHYRNGYREGEFLEYYPDGQLIEKGTWARDERTGTHEIYHANGQLLSRSTYVEGSADGEYEKYWDSGKLREKGTFRAGDRHGPTTIYDATGKAKEVHIYRNDEIIRIEKPR